MIGVQKYIIDNKIKISKLAKEISIDPSCIYDWFRNNRVTPKYVKILSEKFNLQEEYINIKVNDICTYKPKTYLYNDFKIVGDTTIIYLNKRDGSVLETLIDTEDLERIQNMKLKWVSWFCKETQSYYARATQYIGNGEHGKTIYLHKVIMNCEGKILVDHLDHKTLDNRKRNLHITNHQENLINRKGKNKNNKSGYRNVSWNNNDSCWMVQLQVDGKNTRLKNFPEDQLNEAGAYATEMRKKLYDPIYNPKDYMNKDLVVN
ncbi:MAG TPA: hypothetical protein DEG71_09555 [Clostridiales bacterium]|nr:hypothetical protein [Clostridiales bacterium]